MISSVNNTKEIRKALNENLHALLTGKRKILLAKEVNNTLGKIQNEIKMEMHQRLLLRSGDQGVSWFDDNENIKQINDK